ncbi:MAG: VWA domain-containing protein [Pseudomonadota bacterium]
MTGKKPPAKPPAHAGEGGAVEAFLAAVARTPALKPAARKGRLVFALDATMSRQPTWDRAAAIQADMFAAAAAIGGLAIEVVFFRGQGEFKKSPWLDDGNELARRMAKVACRGGLTQIARVLRHAVHEADTGGVAALVYVGDAIEEDADALCALAGTLGMKGVKAFVFQEGDDPLARATFREIARLSGGAYAEFAEGSAERLRALLSAAAVYAAGGWQALSALSQTGDAAARLLIAQMKGGD